jgi:hypothetical protein
MKLDIQSSNIILSCIPEAGVRRRTFYSNTEQYHLQTMEAGIMKDTEQKRVFSRCAQQKKTFSSEAENLACVANSNSCDLGQDRLMNKIDSIP